MGRLYKLAIVVAVMSLLVVTPARGADPNLIKNGSFEEGFVNGVGKGWAAFTNDGHCNYAFVGDGWKPGVWDGMASQLIVIASPVGVEPDRYAGIYQSVAVAPGTTYRLTIHGMVRSSEGSVATSSYGYRVQWAIDYTGGTDWRKLDAAAWQELDWYEWPLSASGYLETFSTDVKATSGKLTLFVRAWKKFGTPNKEAHYNLDAISLVGQAPASPTPTPAPSQGQLPQTGLGLGGLGLAGLLATVALAMRSLRFWRARA